MHSLLQPLHELVRSQIMMSASSRHLYCHHWLADISQNPFFILVAFPSSVVTCFWL